MAESEATRRRRGGPPRWCWTANLTLPAVEAPRPGLKPPPHKTSTPIRMPSAAWQPEQINLAWVRTYRIVFPPISCGFLENRPGWEFSRVQSGQNPRTINFASRWVS